ncbi:hypothetical protein [Streptomyces sp. NPDC050848]|uniref:hypothetical protein n=1 Tax=Streptomyces sp. NPDC050848 TaxID=3155791 RepID=UPI0033E4BFD4
MDTHWRSNRLPRPRSAAAVKRWDYPPETWAEMFREHGFVDVTAVVLPAPPHGSRRIGTLLVRGVRGR